MFGLGELFRAVERLILLIFIMLIWSPSLDFVPIVLEYPNIFPTELPGFSPERDSEFVIDLELGTQPIFMAPYLIDLS